MCPHMILGHWLQKGKMPFTQEIAGRAHGGAAQSISIVALFFFCQCFGGQCHTIVTLSRGVHNVGTKKAPLENQGELSTKLTEGFESTRLPGKRQSLSRRSRQLPLHKGALVPAKRALCRKEDGIGYAEPPLFAQGRRGRGSVGANKKGPPRCIAVGPILILFGYGEQL